MHLILTGATGLVGSATLHAMLRNRSIEKISILSRRPVPMASSPNLEADKRCQTFIQKDFASPPPPETLEQLRGAKGVVWAQGISVNDVNEDEYRKITYIYPLVAAKAFADLRGGESFNFVYVSGDMATTSPGRMTPRFARVKGEAEAALLKLAKEDEYKGLRVFSARPGAVDCIGHPEVEESVRTKPRRITRTLAMPLMSVMRSTWKSVMSPTKELGDVLVMLAAGDGERLKDGPGVSEEGRVLENSVLRKLGGL